MRNLLNAIGNGLQAIAMHFGQKFYGGEIIGRLSEIRKDKERINGAKKRIIELRINVRKQKLANEYVIRGILAYYFDSYIELISSIVKEIIVIQNDVYLRLEAIEENIKNNKREETRIPQRFYDLKNAMHAKIHVTKEIKDNLSEQKRRLIHKKKELISSDYKYYKPHRRLGAKKLVKQILKEGKSFLMQQHKRKKVIEVGDLRLSANRKCSKCGSYIIGNLRYCFVCGSLNDKEINTKDIKISKRKYDLICNRCDMPIDSMWEYCPNCGKEFDHYNLKGCLALTVRFRQPEKKEIIVPIRLGARKRRKIRCAAIAKSGKRCKRFATPGYKFCAIHRGKQKTAKKKTKKKETKKTRCVAITRNGRRCKRFATGRSKFCSIHSMRR